jgi:hypothetical protein
LEPTSLESVWNAETDDAEVVAVGVRTMGDVASKKLETNSSREASASGGIDVVVVGGAGVKVTPGNDVSTAKTGTETLRDRLSGTTVEKVFNVELVGSLPAMGCSKPLED